MREAQKFIEQERARSLRQLTPEQSLQIYRALWARSYQQYDYNQPSPMVQRVQRVFRRYMEAQQRDPTR